MDECLSSSVNFLLLSTLISIVIAKDLTQNELLILSDFLQAVGQNLALITTTYEICEETKKDEKNKNSDASYSTTT